MLLCLLVCAIDREMITPCYNKTILGSKQPVSEIHSFCRATDREIIAVADIRPSFLFGNSFAYVIHLAVFSITYAGISQWLFLICLDIVFSDGFIMCFSMCPQKALQRGRIFTLVTLKGSLYYVFSCEHSGGLIVRMHSHKFCICKAFLRCEFSYAS